MKLQKFIFALVAIGSLTLASCSDTTSEDDTIYEQSIGKKELDGTMV